MFYCDKKKRYDIWTAVIEKYHPAVSPKWCYYLTKVIKCVEMMCQSYELGGAISS